MPPRANKGEMKTDLQTFIELWWSNLSMICTDSAYNWDSVEKVKDIVCLAKCVVEKMFAEVWKLNSSLFSLSALRNFWNRVKLGSLAELYNKQ